MDIKGNRDIKIQRETMSSPGAPLLVEERAVSVDEIHHCAIKHGKRYC